MRHLVGGRYRVLERLGSGGMAEVYLARDDVLERDVAFKVLRPQYADDERLVERFRREAKSAAALSHPNIIAIHDQGETADGVYYIVMEYLPRGTLDERISEGGPLSPRAAAEAAIQVAQALEAAHEKGLVHRDIKPQNILLTESGAVKVADFGIVKAAAHSTLTETGLVMGSVHYMSPEQALGAAVGPASDLYSLGMVLYEMLTGELPCKGEDTARVISEHVNGRPRSPREVDPRLPEGISAVTVRLLARSPSDRHASAAELIEDLGRVRKGLSPSADTIRISHQLTGAPKPKNPTARGPGQSGGQKEPKKWRGADRKKAVAALVWLICLISVLAMLAVAYERGFGLPLEPNSEGESQDVFEPQDKTGPKDKNEPKTKDEPKVDAEPNSEDEPKVPDGAAAGTVFRDDFSGAAGGWPRKNGPDFAANYAGGGYRIYNPPPVPMNALALASGAGTFGDARVEVDAALTGGSGSAAWGVVCRHVGAGNYYEMGLYGDGRPFIAKVKNDQRAILSSGRPSDAVRKAPASNRVRGECAGGKLSLYVNDRKLLEAYDANLATGSVGLFGGYASGAATDVSFDNFSAGRP